MKYRSRSDIAGLILEAANADIAGLILEAANGGVTKTKIMYINHIYRLLNQEIT
jgi:hypothetical protein